MPVQQLELIHQPRNDRFHPSHLWMNMDRNMDKDTNMGIVLLPPDGPPGTLTPARFCPLLQPLAPSALTGSCALPSAHILTRVLQ